MQHETVGGVRATGEAFAQSSGARAFQDLARQVHHAIAHDQAEPLEEGQSGILDESMIILGVFTTLGLKKGNVLKGRRDTSGGDGNEVVCLVRNLTRV